MSIGKLVRVIECSEFDELVKKTYGKRYSSRQQDDCKFEGSTYSFTIPQAYVYDYERDEIPQIINGDVKGVSFEAWKARDNDQPVYASKYNDKGELVEDRDKDGEYDWYLSLFWHRSFYPSIDMVIEDLHKRGLLEEGDYLIQF